MRPRNSQIGWSKESKLLHQVLEQFSELTNIVGSLLPSTTTTTTTAALSFVNPCPAVVNLTVGVPVTLQVNQLTGGTPPYTYLIFPSITPPAGLSWNSATCTLSGTPTATGTFGGKLILGVDSGTGSVNCGLTIIVS